jgi:hypothetical protein
VDKVLNEIAALLVGRSAAELVAARGVVLSVLYPSRTFEKSNVDEQPRRWWFISEMGWGTPVIIGD